MSTAAEVLDELTADERALVAVQGDRVFEYEGTLALRVAYVGRYAEARALALRSLAKRPNPRANYVLGEVYAALGQASAAQQAWARGREAGAPGRRPLDSGHLHHARAALGPYCHTRPMTCARASGWQTSLNERSRRLAICTAWSRCAPAASRCSPWKASWAEARTIAAAVCASNRAYFPLAALLLARIALAQGDTALASSLVQRLLPAGPAEEPGGACISTHWVCSAWRRVLALDAGDLPTARAWLGPTTAGSPGTARCWARPKGNSAGPPTTARRATSRWPASTPSAPSRTPPSRASRSPSSPPTACWANSLPPPASTPTRNPTWPPPWRWPTPAPRPTSGRCVCSHWLRRRLAAERQAAAGVALADAHATLTALQALPALARCDALAAPLPSATNVPAEPPAAPSANLYPVHLTPREVEVLRLVAAGASNREMAATLSRSERTIERHLENIYRKIDARNRADAVAFTLRRGLA